MEPINSDTLVHKGLITAEQLAEARRQKLTTSRKLSDVLVEMGHLTREQMVEHLFVQLHLKIKEALEPLKGLELAIADLYGQCAISFQDNVDFWLALKEQEEGHARNIDAMIGIIYDRPHAFELGFPIRKEAIQTFIAGVHDTREKIRDGKMTKDRILIALKDIERGLIEAKYFDILKSEDLSFNKFVTQIRKETFAHRAKLETLKL